MLQLECKPSPVPQYPCASKAEALEALNHAIAAVKRGWCQNTMAQNKMGHAISIDLYVTPSRIANICSVCLYGGIVLGAQRCRTSNYSDLADALDRAVEVVLRQRGFISGTFKWNDLKGRKKKEVIELLEVIKQKIVQDQFTFIF